jgi:5-methylcytosine-specific restriction protein B
MSNKQISYWFLGASYGDAGDQTERFLKKGIWENGYDDKYIDDVNSINPGDRVAIKSTYTRKYDLPFDNKDQTVSVMALKATGVVLENLYNGKTLKVKWTFLDPQREWYFYTYRRTMWKIEPGEWMNDALIDFAFNGKKQDYKRFINHPFWAERFEDTIQEDHVEIPKMPCLNTILYGPPGTGKTYTTIEKAINITNPGFEYPSDPQSPEGRKTVKAEYERLLKSGQIMFTTFHQSMSYEDFIEGIKPNTDGNENRVYYTIQPGVLKRISDTARKNYENSQKSAEILKKEKSAEQVLSDFAESISEEITQNGKYRLNDKVFIMEVEDDAFRYSGENWEHHAAGIRMKFSDLIEFYKSDIHERKQIKDLSNISQLAKQHATYYKIVYDRMMEFEKSNKTVIDNPQTEKLKKYVLIIDEINRGNISQIFGELITLIEDDKRAGRSEALEVTLPYSKETFSVPSNLYIIGTMNTADRSVEALDTALRRRFSFVEMMPDYSTLDNLNDCAGINIIDMLENMNERISYLLDRDHQIGHSYFMPLIGINDDETKKETLQHIFKNKIIPLLQEYFYNDYGKIRLIVGDAFVEPVAKPAFAVKDDEELDRETYKLRELTGEFDILSALKAAFPNAVK